MKKTLVIDNYDSFVFNLVQYLGEFKGNPEVFRNDEITLEQAKAFNPTHILISPGPGHPSDPHYFGVSRAIIEEMGKTIPVLGVCLGHQGIVDIFGGDVVSAPCIMHGKTSLITHNEKGVFQNISSPLEVMRYHSLCADAANIPDCLELTAQTDDEIVMGVSHKEYPIHGIQFHPESIGTDSGKQIIKNFLNL